MGKPGHGGYRNSLAAMHTSRSRTSIRSGRRLRRQRTASSRGLADATHGSTPVYSSCCANEETRRSRSSTSPMSSSQVLRIDRPRAIARDRGTRPAQVIERKLLESAAPISASATLSYAQNWARLRQENASLAIIENGTLVSAPIPHVRRQNRLLCDTEWQSVTRMLGAFYSTARAEGFNAPDLRFILSRLAALVESGQLEGKGDLATLDGQRDSWVRRPR